MNAADVMVTNVITTTPDARVQDVAETLLRNRISAMPVVGPQGELVGIISEGDLMRRPESDTEPRRSWWLDLLTSKEVMAAEFVRMHSQKVSDLMTSHVITAAPDTPVREIANLLEKNGIKRVPVVKDGKVVGIVSRANLLQALASLRKEQAPQVTPDDAAIRNKVLAQLKLEPWARLSLLNVVVQDGTVDLWGMVDSIAEKKAVRVVAETTPGVRAVHDNIVVQPVMPGA